MREILLIALREMYDLTPYEAEKLALEIDRMAEWCRDPDRKPKEGQSDGRD